MSSNALSRMSPGALTGLTDLNELSLDHNQLIAVPEVALHAPVSLKVLDLSFNRIPFLQNDSFSQLEHLQLLNLYANSLEEIDPLAFVGLRSLRQLDLRMNQLLRVPTLSFRPLTELETLHIGQNPFGELTTSAFEGLAKLRQLFIVSCAKLASIDLNAFSGVTRLETLMISNNPQLRQINEMAFEKPNSLRQLLLADNALSSIPEQLLNWSQLTELDLGRNPWQCDCQLEWLPRALRSVYGREVALPSIRCARPNRLTGRPISTLTAADFNCPQSPANRAVFTLALLVAVLVLLTTIVAAAFRFYRHLCCCEAGGSSRDSQSKSPLYYRSSAGSLPYSSHYEQSNSSKKQLLFAGFGTPPTRAVPTQLDDDDPTYMSPNDFYYTIHTPSTTRTVFMPATLARDETFRIISKYPVPITEL